MSEGMVIGYGIRLKDYRLRLKNSEIIIVQSVCVYFYLSRFCRIIPCVDKDFYFRLTIFNLTSIVYTLSIYITVLKCNAILEIVDIMPGTSTEIKD